MKTQVKIIAILMFLTAFAIIACTGTNDPPRRLKSQQLARLHMEILIRQLP